MPLIHILVITGYDGGEGQYFYYMDFMMTPFMIKYKPELTIIKGRKAYHVHCAAVQRLLGKQPAH